MTFYFLGAVLLVAGAVVAFITWRNAQPTNTVGQLLETLQTTEKGSGSPADGASTKA